MKPLITYLVLFSFTFLSLTPSGLTFSQLKAYDDFELDELDLGLDDDEIGESDRRESGTRESGEFSFDDPEEEFDNEFASEPAYDSSGKQKIAAFYLFQDSFSRKSAGGSAAETARYLSSSEYDYVAAEAAFSAGSSSASRRNLEDGLKVFEAAKSLYNDLDLEEAIAKFQTAKRMIEKQIDSLDDLKVLGEILLYLGSSHKMLDENEDATAFFYDYLNIYPDAELDDIIFSPEIISFFDRVKEDYLMLPHGSVKVESSPEGALVSIDGRIVGVTPAKIYGVNEGKHYYKLHKNGYRDRSGVVSVRERRESRVSENLPKHENSRFIEDAESFMTLEYGRLSMLRKSVEVADKMSVDMILVTYLTVDGEKVKYSGHLVDREKRSFKKVETSFILPERRSLSEVDELYQFHRDLIGDSYGFKPISDVALDEADILGLDSAVSDEGGKKKESKPVYKQWWLWTILGVVVLGGVGAGAYFGITEANKSKGSGASLEINFK
ncbi:MAG: PEGA domain-containing protein [bacterium]